MGGTAAREGAVIAVEEARLSRAAAAGDGSAFAELYERYEPRAFNLAERITGSEDAAAKIVQEAFLKAMRRQRRLTDGELSFGPYLLGVARDLAHERAPRHPPVPPAQETGSDRGAEEEEVRAANTRLPERQREALALRELEGLSYAEIASMMDVSQKAVAQLLARARINLRDEMRGTALASVSPSADCERALSLIASREDEQLEPASAEATWLDDHLAGCDRCRLGVEALQEAAASYRAWAPLAAPAWLLKETMTRAAEQANADWTEVIETTAAARTRLSSLPGMPAPYLGEVPAEEPPRSRRPARRGLMAASLAVLLALVGLAAALAGTRHSAPVPADESAKQAGEVGRRSTGQDGARSGKPASSRAKGAKKAASPKSSSTELAQETAPAPVSAEGPSGEGSGNQGARHPSAPSGKTAVGAPRQTSSPNSSPRPRSPRTTTPPAPTTTTTTTPAPVVEASPPPEEASTAPPHGHEPPGKPADRPPR